ncbi:MAG: hypothetical protein V4641_16675 [Pseudomonadota bacterium]
MTIVSMLAEDKSDFLCKRYASMASSYFDHREAAGVPTAQVPLENLFRVLEMYKNNTFSDDSRKGVLALNNSSGKFSEAPSADDWQVNIKAAMQHALGTTFENVSEADAVKELQNALRWLVVDGEIPDRVGAVRRAKTFFTELSSAL